MFRSSRINNKINNIHKKAPRIVYSDYKSTFKELLDKGTSFSVHHRNIQTSAIEIYKHAQFSKLTELCHTTSEHPISFRAEFRKQ